MEDDTFSKDSEIQSILSSLESKYYPEKGKRSWIKHFSVVSGDLDLTSEQIEDDFTRELKLYENSLNNSKLMIEKLTKAKIPVWRPSDFKAETFKSDERMKKIEKYLNDIKTKINVVEKRRDAKNKKKFGNEAHKRHVRAKQMKSFENKAKKHKSSRNNRSAKNFKRKKS